MSVIAHGDEQCRGRKRIDVFRGVMSDADAGFVHHLCGEGVDAVREGPGGSDLQHIAEEFASPRLSHLTAA